MEKAKTIGELLEEARRKSGAPKLAGHNIMDLKRFAPDTRHMIAFDVLSYDSPIGFKGEKTRAFLTDQGYERSLENQRLRHIKIKTMPELWADISITTITGIYNILPPGKELMNNGGNPHRKKPGITR